ncbi:MAG: DMT family transporter [Gemmatimonadetes bacterium]|nr:DMT family transporter [Gemmatimonadota bacterium]
MTVVPPGLKAMVGSAFFFSIMAALAKLAGVTVPLFEIVFARSLAVAVLSGAQLAWSGTGFRGKEPRILVLRGVLGFVSLSCYHYAVIHLPLAAATVIHFVNPVFTAFIAALWLREHLGLREAALVVASLAGVVLVARPGFLFGGEGALEPFPVLIGLCGAILSAAAYTTVRRLRAEPPMLIVFYFAVVCTLLATPLVIRDYRPLTWAEMGLLVCVGLTTHLGQVFLTWGFRLERAGRASAVGYLQIVLAALWGWLLFSDVPDAWTWVGAAVIVGCTLLLVRLHPVR